MHPNQRSFTRPVLSAFALVVATSMSGCIGDAAGPSIDRAGQFQIVPNFQSHFPAGLVPIDRVRVLLERNDRAEAALDTLIQVSPRDSVLDLNLPVSLLTAADTFNASIALITQAGDTAYRGGPLKIVSSALRADRPVQTVIPIFYAGVGAHADSVVIISQPPSVFAGDTTAFQAVAFENGVPVPGTPIAWVSLDPVKALVPKPSVGQVVANNQRGVARVVAQLINGPADTGAVTVNLPPAIILPVSGNLQIARVRAPVSPFVAQLKAVDNVPVVGAWVKFAIVNGGGTLSVDSVLSDASGKASTQLTLGSGIGPQIVRVTSSVGGSQTLFTTTAVPAAVAQIWNNTAGGLWSVATNWSTGLVPGPLDTVLINLAGTYTVTLDQATSVAALLLGGGSGTQTLAASGRTLTVAGTSVVGALGVLNLSGSTIAGPGTVTSQGTIKLVNSTLNGLENRGLAVVNGASTIGGTLLTFAGSTLKIQGTSGSGGPGNGDTELNVTNGFTNNGVIELTSISSATAAAMNVLSGMLSNAASASIVALPGAGGSRSIDADIDNLGTITVNQALSFNCPSGNSYNRGIIDLRAGNLSVANNLSLLTGSVVNSYVSSASAYTQLGVSGLASLGGELHMDFSNHAPGLLESFSPVNYGSHSSSFGTTTGLGLGGLLLNILPGLTSVVVSFLL